MNNLRKGVFYMPSPNFVYKCRIIRVVDGDTVDAEIDLGFNMRNVDRVRLVGIDTPESRTRNLREKQLGLDSKKFLKDTIRLQKEPIRIHTTKEGKFGRILGTLYGDNDTNINELLILNNHARQYYGGSKDELGPWVYEEGCNCGGKRLSRGQSCSGIWRRWTSDGYIPL
jgi:endonuclease YncB( thermonuclease family)